MSTMDQLRDGLVIGLSSCGQGDSSESGQISWIQGTPPREGVLPTSTADRAAVVATVTPDIPPSPTTQPTNPPDDLVSPTVEVTSAPTSDVTTGAARIESDADRMTFLPNELGLIPVLMYHDIVDKPSTTVAYTRTLTDFKADLQRLYDDGFVIVPLRDVILNQMTIPAGKHPVVLTFDDGIANQFRYLVDDDGALTIDPTSAVGVLEAFSAQHPDFGRGGFFAVPPDWCFDWTAAAAEPDQTPLCADKLQWLVDNGYEVGNHTLGHSDLLDLDDSTFQEKVGQGWVGLQAYVADLQPDILAMPFGNYPDLKKHHAQRQMMRDGFDYDGETIKLLGALQVGAEPAVSPNSTGWDPLFIARIQAYDGEYGSDEWLSVLENDPTSIYTSDGDDTTVSVPETLPPSIEGTLDTDRVESEGRTVLIYDPETGAIV